MRLIARCRWMSRPPWWTRAIRAPTRRRSRRRCFRWRSDAPRWAPWTTAIRCSLRIRGCASLRARRFSPGRCVTSPSYQGSGETAVYRQNAGKHAGNTVTFRADWHRRAASSLSPRRRLAPSAHADGSAPWGSQGWGARKGRGSRTLPVTSAVGYERWLSRPRGSLRLRSSGVPRASSVSSARACAGVSGSVFRQSYERSPHSFLTGIRGSGLLPSDRGETVMLRADWLSRVARNHAHADDWHPGGGFLAHITAIRLSTRALNPIELLPIKGECSVR